jgi:transposase-like protein
MLKDRPMYSLGVLGLEAVRLVKESGKPAAQISRDLGVSVKSLKCWVKQQEIDSGTRKALPLLKRWEF